MTLLASSLSCQRNGRIVFSNLSFSLEAGEGLIVTGHNGSGKSSLLAILAGRLRSWTGGYHLSYGMYRYEGQDIARLTHWLGHRDGLKAALTVLENLDVYRVLLGSRGEKPEAALEWFGILALRDVPVAWLSAGQRRRVALARLLVAHRPLWLLDEPATALDTKGQGALGALMQAHLAAGGLIVAATHQVLHLKNVKSLFLDNDTEAGNPS
jgi:heme exporter protein A